MASTDRIDGLTAAEAIKAPVRTVATANVATLNGEQTINSLALVDGDRILLTAQTDSVYNGIWQVNANADWTRTKDCDGNRDLRQGTIVLSADTSSLNYRVTTADPIVIGTSSLTFVPAGELYTASSIVHEQVIATDSQTLVPVSQAYYQSVNHLSVYVNGARVVAGVDYTETSTTSITFVTPLTLNDVVDLYVGVLSTSTATGSASVSHTSPGTGATERTVYSRLSDVVSVKDFGATGDGVADDTAEIQAAVDYAESTGASVYIPTGEYIITDTIVVDEAITVYGDGPGSFIHCQSTDSSSAFHWSSTQYLNGGCFRDFKIQCDPTAGHCIEVVFGLVYCSLIRMYLDQDDTSSSVLHGSFNGSGGIYDCTFGDSSFWGITTAHTAAAVNLVSVDTGRINNNSFSRIRCDRSGTGYFFNIECQAAGSWNWGNTLRELQGEVVNQGFVKLSGAKQHRLQDIMFWDASSFASGAISADVILLTSSGSGRSCRSTIIESYDRTAGTLDGSTYDVNLDDADDTVFINCASVSSDTEFNINSKRVTILGPKISEVWTGLNSTNSTLVRHDEISTPMLITPRGTEVTIASGVITADNSTHKIDTEADAASDDLDTITAGVDGQWLLLKPANGSRTIVIKDATGNIAAPGDVTLDNLHDCCLLQYDALLALWVVVSVSDNGA